MAWLKWVHRSSSLFATLLIALFFSATLASELSGNVQAVQQVKQLIVLPGLFLLIPAIAAAGATGKFMTRRRRGRALSTKQRRTLAVALTGAFVLLPAALWLRHLALAGSFGPQFYLVQGIELLAGASNLTLMGLNIYDGMKLSGRINRIRRKSSVEAG